MCFELSDSIIIIIIIIIINYCFSVNILCLYAKYSWHSANLRSITNDV